MSRPGPTMADLLLGVWVVGVFLLFLSQYSHLFKPILKTLASLAS